MANGEINKTQTGRTEKKLRVVLQGRVAVFWSFFRL